MAAEDYRTTIGLEVHAELKTTTKMFCGCLNNADEKTPNLNICPVCMAHPGTLPVINKAAVRSVLRVGHAINARLADFTEFDRKNYFYPDIPKGYQISQFQHPLVAGGVLHGVEITRIHLEEDTARSQHVGNKSLVDYNRAGVPLMELVTEPVIHSAEDAGAFARELQLLLRTLGVSDANMEKGEMRVEANLSISKTDQLGTKVEVKNLNSFRSVERAIAFEIARQVKLLDAGGAVVQETLGWDEGRQATYVQRKKESSHDYRYFPDPDLPKLVVSEIPEFSAEALRATLPELPWVKRERYLGYGLKADDAEMFVVDKKYGTLFEATRAITPDATTIVANYIASDIAGLVAKLGDTGLAHITPEGLAAVATSLNAQEISSRGAKDAIAEVFTNGGKLEVVYKNYLQQSDTGVLGTVVAEVIAANPGVAADYKAGKAAAMQFLVGQGMKASKGSANPAALKALFEEALKA
jgi:aspartyl-tRNA(Asn)/glutamyl-tRNA(Gln) amidotransferase subunit B